ncbi:hypothetical protein [Leptolyngbya sp. PCC 6406]|uniref:hypothetical protein n=1 Tax=Leptolyngbya sp. PCC 6406 TaxID=1173264 RepID=UPI00090710A2|nr:hypothetical protein [Leptolyngbya sp. PCC 6406]
MTDTYHKESQLGASRRRLEDASALHSCKRWSGSIYLGGYAIECSLKSLICFDEEKSNFKDTSVFKEGIQGASLHNLAILFGKISSLSRIIEIDRTGKYKDEWKIITSTWVSNEIRYSPYLGDEKASTQFINAVKRWHQIILDKQGEAS